MNHYCTYFDGGFLLQGVALWQSLAAHDPDAVLWVLALDEEAAEPLRMLGEANLRVVTLGELEAADPGLRATKASRSRVEYYFTLSPCWPRYLLQARPEIERLIYLDADLYLFANPRPIWDDLARGSILLGAHRFPRFLAHYERHGRYNVGVLGWRRDAAGLACLDHWREQCLAWCHDVVEDGKYADQKYLEQWPQRFSGVVECMHPGVNLAPWNWLAHRCEVVTGAVRVDGQPLIGFHFARFRALVDDRWWQSGQLDYGVMPWSLRQAVYGTYWRGLQRARQMVEAALPAWRPPHTPGRSGRSALRGLPLRILFGSDWLRIGDYFISGRLGLGRYSGRFLAWLRTIFLRR